MNIKIFISYLLLLSLASCSGFLKVEPREEVSINEQFSTLQGVKTALNGVYYGTERLISDFNYVYADLQGGNLTFTPRKSGTSKGIQIVGTEAELIYNFNDNAIDSRFNAYYQDSYAIINNINNILKYGENVSADPKIKNQIRAEALAMRAFIHFELSKYYAQQYVFTNDGTHLGIAYIDDVLIAGRDFPKRASLSENYNAMEKDLKEALKIITLESALAGPNYSYINKNTINTILSIIELNRKNYKASIEYASEIINGGGLRLTPSANYIEQWQRPNKPLDEVIFVLTPPTDGSGTVTSSLTEFYRLVVDNNNQAIDYAAYVASSDLPTLYANEDIRKNTLKTADLDVKQGTEFKKKAFLFTIKYQDNPETVIYRLSEIYLIIAEAAARMGDVTLALKNLNEIRIRAGLAPLQGNENLLEEIFLERRREFAFESKLFFDIARFKKNVDRKNDCLATQCKLNYPNPKFILPIPQSTLNVNPQMIQNEGY